jgi:NAD(P)-dependent dehydrogenase (short-subunit alcohol dehydrogenase family)
MSQTHEHALVTGGSSGIGWAVVQRLLDRSLDVSVLDLNPPAEPHRAGSSAVRYVAVDVTDEQAVDEAVRTAAEDLGPPNRLVTSHGIRGEFVPALDLDLEVMRRVLDVHVVGTLVVARALVRAMTVGGNEPSTGSIVTVSSTTAYGGWANQADYGTAKAAISQLTQNLAIEWAPLGIRVNSVAPGHTLTPMVQQMIDQGYDVAATKARTPLGRLCAPDEMAAAIENLLLDATFVTGVCLPVDGGWTAVGK